MGEPSPRPRAPDLVGRGPAGEGLEFRITETRNLVLLVFLATRCDGCDEFWRGFSGEVHDLMRGIDPVIVTKGPATNSGAEVANLAAGTNVPVVMSDAAWADYGVYAYPFLVLVESANRTILAETVAFTWSDLEELVRRASR